MKAQLPNDQLVCNNLTIQPQVATTLGNTAGSPTATVSVAVTSTQITPTGSQNSSPDAHKSSISSGGYAGIAVGIAGFIALCSLAYYCIRRKRANKNASSGVVAEQSKINELPGGGPYRDTEAELEEVRGVHELDPGNRNWFPNREDGVRDRPFVEL